MAKSYRNQLLDCIEELESRLSDVNDKIAVLDKTKQNSIKLFWKLFGKEDIYVQQKGELLEEQTELIQKIESNKQELAQNYVYSRTIFVMGTRFRDNGFEPFYILSGFGRGFEEDFTFVHTKNVELVPEPTNTHDSNAIKVIAEGYFIGYIDRRYNRGLRKYLDKGKYILDMEVIGYGKWEDEYEIRYDIKVKAKKI
ncbi:TPA: HIRAN domain-containing protein [Streptococcus agalactiae]|nr:HIRAN domain-containing protein [Streptococcus agalactiae]